MALETLRKDRAAGRFERKLLIHVIEDKANQDPEAVYAEFPISATGFEEGFYKVTYAAFVNAINGLAWWLHETLGPSKDFETLAYIGLNDLRYYALLFGAVKAGYKILFTSPRNSVAAHQNLFDTLKCQTLISSIPNAPPIIGVATACNVRLLTIPSLEELLGKNYNHFAYKRTYKSASKEPLVVLHTSGTTGLPKPIGWTNEYAASWIEWLLTTPPDGYTSAADLWLGKRLFFPFPPFHAGGLFGSIFASIWGGTICLHAPRGVTMPSAQLIIDALKQTSFQCVAIPPFFASEISRDSDMLDILSEHVESMFYAGGHLPQAVGDAICKKMKLFGHMAQTESGLLPTLCPIEIDQWRADEWSYFRFDIDHGIGFEKIVDGEFELVVQRSQRLECEIPCFAVFPEKVLHRTGDLYMPHPHPDKTGLWQYRGRRDDIIVFLNGEKTNPISMEETILQHPEVQAVLVVGTLRFQAALLIEPVNEESLTATQRAELIERVWPIIQEANRDCPRHAQIQKQYVMFTNPQKPMRRAGKGTVQRQPTLELYKDEIDSLYAVAEKIMVPAADKGDSESFLNAKDVNSVSAAVRKALASCEHLDSILASKNFFNAGMDSLQAIQMTRLLKSSLALPEFDITTVYTNPTVDSLVNRIMGLFDQQKTSEEMQKKTSEQNIEDTFMRYKALLDKINTQKEQEIEKSAPRNIRERKVLLTGSTGSLGSHILSALYKCSDISHIYCVNRGQDSRSRQMHKCEIYGLSGHFTDSKVTFLDGDVCKDNLGLSAEIYRELRMSITDIVHNAWPVNFNLSLATFDSQLLGITKLVSLVAHASCSCKVLFVSSTSSVGSLPQPTVPETIIADTSAPLPMGYSESKHIAERLIDYATAVIPSLSATVVRFGQLAGPAHVPGPWSKREWFPSLVTSSLFLGALPENLGRGQEVIDWVPLDYAAEALVEFVLGRENSKSQGAKVFHPKNQSPLAWAELRDIILAGLNEKKVVQGSKKAVELVSLNEWVARLRCEAEKPGSLSDLERTLEQNPAVKLMGFFDSLLSNKGYVEVDGEAALQASQHLRLLNGLDPQWVRQWLQGWI